MTESLTTVVAGAVAQNTLPIPRDTSRFSHLWPDPCPEIRPDAPPFLECRISLQMAIEGQDTPNWLVPGPYKPDSLDEVCLDGNYRHDEPVNPEK